MIIETTTELVGAQTQFLRRPGAVSFKRLLATVLNAERRTGPVCMVSDHGVHDGEEFPGARDEGDFLGFSRSAQALVEDAELRIPAAPAERGEVKRGADAAPPTPDHPFPPQRATIPSQGRHAGQGRDLLVAERAELRQLPPQDCADDRPDAPDALQ